MGKDWATPGRILRTYSAPNCAGIGFDPSRRTIWYCENALSDQIYEIEPNSGVVLTTLRGPAAGYLGGFSYCGLEVDLQGRIWVVDRRTRMVYRIQAPAAALPGGSYVDPSMGFIAPGECVTFAFIFPDHSVPVGDYCFDLYFQPAGEDILPSTIPTCIQVQPFSPRGWSLISVPVIASPSSPVLQFIDDITPFVVDHTTSNLYSFNQDGGIYELPSVFQRGRGYFLLTYYDNTCWDVYGAPYASGDYTYHVYHPATSPHEGWWLAGNPFNARVDWNDVMVATIQHRWPGLAPADWDDSLAAYIANGAYTTWSQAYGSMSYSWVSGFGFGVSHEVDSWIGYWINVLKGNVDLIYPQAGVYETFTKVAAKGAIVKTVNPAEFALRISAKGTAGSDVRNDLYNYIVVDEDALDGNDIYDICEPDVAPPSGFFNGYFEQGINRLMVDAKDNFNSSSKTWTFVVKDLPAGMVVKLMWPRNRMPSGSDCSWGVNTIDSRWHLTITDLTTSVTRDMHADTVYSFTYNGIRRFRITLSDISTGAPETNLPKEFALSPNFPNPFNATTQFTVALPKESDLTVEIYDMLGHKVTTMFDGHKPVGWHKMVWDGRDASGHDVPSGVYLYKVVAGDYRDVRKMTLIK
jgi:hypothetical protein